VSMHIELSGPGPQFATHTTSASQSAALEEPPQPRLMISRRHPCRSTCCQTCQAKSRTTRDTPPIVTLTSPWG